MKYDFTQPWYHGSPHKLTVLRTGSTITQKRELARIFSHKPTIVSVFDDGSIKHNGTLPGYLYLIVDEITNEDIKPHPQSTMMEGDEWLTTHEMTLKFLCNTEIIMDEQLTKEEFLELKRRADEISASDKL